jgi:hypothetical protein
MVALLAAAGTEYLYAKKNGAIGSSVIGGDWRFPFSTLCRVTVISEKRVRVTIPSSVGSTLVVSVILKGSVSSKNCR